MLKKIRIELKSLSNSEKAAHHQKFFKTAKGEYGEGDIFIGVTVPNLRKLSRKYKSLSLKETEKLLQSKFHEERLLALFILILKFQNKNITETEKTTIYKIYINNMQYINNWDLVDSSAHYIVGSYLLNKDKAVLYKLAKSQILWERRIAIISTFFYIRQNDFRDTLKIAEILLNDEHDLIHKAVGWMLRETGKRNLEVEQEFLNKFYKVMPRTMLRYSIERFSKNDKNKYMS